MNPVLRRQWRIQNCLHTILEVHEFMADRLVSPEVLEQMESLQDLLHHFHPSTLNERDLQHIEASTGRLLIELRNMFRTRGLRFIYSGYRH